MSKEIGSVIKTCQQGEVRDQVVASVAILPNVERRMNTDPFQTLPKMNEEGTVLNSSYGASTALLTSQIGPQQGEKTTGRYP